MTLLARNMALLSCPECDGAVTLSAEREDRVRCERGHEFPISSGIPMFARVARSPQDPADATSASFAYEFTALDPELTPERKRREDVVTFFRATGLDPNVYQRVPNSAKRRDLTPEDIGYEPDGHLLRDKVVLDAGCGAGRFSRLAALYGASVIALDRSDAVHRAARVCAGLDVTVVQADLMRPPLKEASFDVVFSIGVLHHTVDTRAGLHAIARLVRPGGQLAVWVYPPEYWAGTIRGTVTRSLRRLLLRAPVGGRAAFCRYILLPIGRLQMRLARRRWTKLLSAPLFILNIPRYEDREVMLTTIFDYWASPTIRTHRPEELYDWLTEIGFADIRILPMPTAVLATRPS